MVFACGLARAAVAGASFAGACVAGAGTGAAVGLVFGQSSVDDTNEVVDALAQLAEEARLAIEHDTPIRVAVACSEYGIVDLALHRDLVGAFCLLCDGTHPPKTEYRGGASGPRCRQIRHLQSGLIHVSGPDIHHGVYASFRWFSWRPPAIGG